MKETFNPDFYIAVATVVPLLYITLFLQGRSVQHFAKKFGPKYSAMSDQNEALMIRTGLRPYYGELGPAPRGSMAFGVAFYTVLVMLLAGPVAVGYSFWALFFQADVFYMRMVVMLATFLLLLLVSFSPSVVILRSFFSEGGDEANPADSEPSEEQ